MGATEEPTWAACPVAQAEIKRRVRGHAKRPAKHTCKDDDCKPASCQYGHLENI